MRIGTSGRTLVLLLGLITPAYAAAQETGKVQGRVTDAGSGQPIAGAQITIAGTRVGNISNAEGFYFINNVPAGLHDIAAEFIGYQGVTVRQQRVLAGQTLTIDFKLQQSAVQIAALEIIGETQPLVPRDQVGSKNIVTGQTVDELPVDNVNQIITLQPGVVAGGLKGFSIRGGRSGEEAVFVDGVLIRNFNLGTSNLQIGTNSVSEVDVLTGGFSAQFGEAQSGIVNFVTRTGGRRWNGAFDTKLDYTYGSGSRVFLTGKLSRNQNRGVSLVPNGTGVINLYNPSSFGGVRAHSRAFILGWTHNFVQSADQALAVDLKLALTHDWGVGGVLDREWDLDNRNPFLGFAFSDMQFVVDESNYPVDKALVQRFLRNEGQLTPFDVTRTDLGLAQEFRLNPYGVASGFSDRGLGGFFGYNDEKQRQARLTIDWQINPQNRLKFGGDYTDIDLEFAAVAYQTLSFAQMWVESPKRASLFVQDRLDLGDMVVEGGLRYDRFDPNTSFPVTPGYYDLDDPTSFAQAPIRSTFSPRLGISFPVTVNSTFRLSYGHFSQLPDLNEYYFGKNTDFFRFRNTNANDRFARPADISKTIAFEFGYRQLLSPDFVLDIAAYNRDKTKDVTYRKLAWGDPSNPGSTAYLNTLTNSDFGTIRGVDVRLDRRFGRLMDLMVGYSYQDARNTGTDPLMFTRLFARIEGNANQLLGLPPNPAQAMRATEENRKHNVTGNFSLHFPANYAHPLLRNSGLFGTFRLVSGFPYSPVTDVGQAIVTGPPSGLFAGELRDDEVSTARMPWNKTFDLKAQKGVRLKNWNTNLFVDARNVLDLDNQTGVFLTNGDISDEGVFQQIIDGHRQTLGGGTAVDRINLASLADAGAGVLNEVDLIALRRAEARFGNGDGIFDSSEQMRAFRSATLLNAMATPGVAGLIGSGRRVRLGVEIAF